MTTTEMLVSGIQSELINYAVAGATLAVILLAVVGLCTVVKAVAAR